MVIATLHFISQQPVSGSPSVVTSWVELLTVISILALCTAGYRKVECHHAGCHRLGRFPHGPYRLCQKHHPTVPSDGRITGEHIARV